MLKADKTGVIVRLKLAPKSSKNALVKIEADADGKTHLKATVTAVPEKGKANGALIKLLSKKLGLPKTSIRLIAGEQSRYKTVHIDGNPEDLLNELTIRFRVLGLMG